PETSVDKRVRVTVARITYGLAHTLHLCSRTDVMSRGHYILHCLCAVQNLGQRRSKTWQRKGPYGPASTQSRPGPYGPKSGHTDHPISTPTPRTVPVRLSRQQS